MITPGLAYDKRNGHRSLKSDRCAERFVQLGVVGRRASSTDSGRPASAECASWTASRPLCILFFRPQGIICGRPSVYYTIWLEPEYRLMQCTKPRCQWAWCTSTL